MPGLQVVGQKDDSRNDQVEQDTQELLLSCLGYAWTTRTTCVASSFNSMMDVTDKHLVHSSSPSVYEDAAEWCRAIDAAPYHSHP